MPSGTSLPTVSILKPLKGLDPELTQNIKSFYTQEYGEYEVLLGFVDACDVGISEAHKSTAESGTCSIRLVIAEKNRVTNQKASNLQGLVEAANIRFS